MEMAWLPLGIDSKIWHQAPLLSLGLQAVHAPYMRSSLEAGLIQLGLVGTRTHHTSSPAGKARQF